jgi:hypothetical protein
MARLRNKLGAALLHAEVMAAAAEEPALERAPTVLRNVRQAVDALEGLDRALLDPANAPAPGGP